MSRASLGSVVVEAEVVVVTAAGAATELLLEPPLLAGVSSSQAVRPATIAAAIPHARSLFAVFILWFLLNELNEIAMNISAERLETPRGV